MMVIVLNEATLTRHHAGCHKTCYLKFNLTKLEQLQKKLMAHQLYTHVQITALLVLLCNKPEGLHNASTYICTTLMQKFAHVQSS